MKKLLIEVGHPAHVHQFKHLYWELLKLGWEVRFVAKDKDIVIYLLEHYNIPYFKLAKTSSGVVKKILSIPSIDLKYHRIVKSFEPDIIISRVSPYSGHVSFINGINHICFTDTENVELLDLIAAPFANYIFTSENFKRDYGKKHIRYAGSHELAYLHPNRFSPNAEVLKDIGISRGDPFTIVRFVNWKAHHDIGQQGFTLENKIHLVNELVKYNKVFITSEGVIPQELLKYKISVAPEKMHDLLYFATLFFGESSTMAEEAAVLGTPAIYISTSGHFFGIIEELQDAGLLKYFHPNGFNRSLEFALSILSGRNIKKEQRELLTKYLQSKIDVTQFMVDLVIGFPDNIVRLREKNR
ncbi:MAG: DUF354 domain-containing protein [Bacteroidetes bacterium]|nr:DUF354 domain-containing protein [Bacteroidota bacterium]